jgi:ABC-type uncharacterized transport system involved in gliding motility auxiliary subunit
VLFRSATAGVLQQLPGAKTTFTPLLMTSVDSMEIPVAKVQGQPDLEALLRDFKSDGKPLTLAARVSGVVDTAFPDGPPKEEKPKDEKTDPAKTEPPLPPQIKTSAQPVNVVIVADTDILEDRFWVQVQDFFGQRVVLPVANNSDFVNNAVDVLAGGNDLISLRSRGTSARPFELVESIQRVADERYQSTAKDLEDKLKATQAKIQELRGGKEGRTNVTPAASETATLENFRSEMLQTRQQLRKVQLAERIDINRLKAWLEFFNVAAIPILVGLAALIVGLVRLNRRKRRPGSA